MSNFCMECGVENLDNAKFCKKCGQKLDDTEVETSSKPSNTNNVISKTSGKAIASLVLSILWMYGLGSLLAIILGHMARTEIRNSNGKLTGDGMAVAGLVIGYLLFVVVFLGILAAVAVPKLAATQ